MDCIYTNTKGNFDLEYTLQFFDDLPALSSASGQHKNNKTSFSCGFVVKYHKQEC